jgi:hypothetical protein
MTEALFMLAALVALLAMYFVLTSRFSGLMLRKHERDGVEWSVSSGFGLWLRRIVLWGLAAFGLYALVAFVAGNL